MKKRGQVTIFIILAIVIVVLGVLIYMFLPQIKTNLGFEAQSPSAIMQSCLQDAIMDNVQSLSLQGGYVNPTHYFLHQDNKIQYLCYTNEYYKLCVMQEPLLINHIENEIKTSTQEQVNSCFEGMVKSYEKAGYDVALRGEGTEVELLPKRIVMSFGHTLSLKRGEKVISYGREESSQISVVLNNNLYELASIANSILEFEATYGDAETTTYMDYYHDLKVEKKKQSDGTTIYILTDRNTGEQFQFASRSIAWPAGYGIVEALK